jgi:hypothetical protein
VTRVGSSWRRRAVIGAIVLLLVGAGRWIDFPKLAGGFKGDEATYVLMAFSAAYDLDLNYTSDHRDLDRFFDLYRDRQTGQPRGPEGVFLKRGYRLSWSANNPFSVTRTPIPTTEHLEYAKAFAYPLAAAPFARLGGLWGIFVFNVLLLALCVWLAARFCGAWTKSAAGVVCGVLFLLASNVPIWTAWLTPEMFNFTLVFAAYFLWLYKEVTAPPASARSWVFGPWSDVAAALLIGIATYSKITHAGLICPMLVWWLLKLNWRRVAFVGAAFALGYVGLFAVNDITTGNWNYQGSFDANGQEDLGGRRTYYGNYPYDSAGTPFDTKSSNPMITNNSDSEELLSVEMLPVLRHNAWYFLVGRHSGLIPYFFPGVLVLLAFLWKWRSARAWQWLTFMATIGSAVIMLLFTPWTWNGDGGPPGNRYFLSIYPTMLFLMPEAWSFAKSVVAGLVGGAFTGAMTLHPFRATKEPWRNVEQPPLRWLPVELTIMNALPVRLIHRRQRIQWNSDIQFYFMDDNTYDVEPRGFWIRGKSEAQIVVKTDRPLEGVKLVIQANTPGRAAASMGSESWSADLAAGERATVEFHPGPGVRSDRAHAYLLKLSTSGGYVPSQVDPASPDHRFIGIFIEPTFLDRVKR